MCKSFYHKSPPGGNNKRHIQILLRSNYYIDIKTSWMGRSKGMKKKSTHHNVGISIQELDTFLQTPETALQTAQQEPGKLILCSCESQVGSQSCPLGLPLERIKSQSVISVLNCLIPFFTLHNLLNTALNFTFKKKTNTPLSLWSRYSSKTLMIWMIERMREPKARVPVWYLQQSTNGFNQNQQLFSLTKKQKTKHILVEEIEQRKTRWAPEKRISRKSPERSS